MLKIDPANVVAIPSDYANAKGRASSYFVYDEIAEEAARHAFEGCGVVETSNAGEKSQTIH